MPKSWRGRKGFLLLFFFFEEKNGPTSALCTRPSTLKDFKKETGTP